MSELLIIAENIAREAHAGQLYNDDKDDYIDYHIIPVVNMITKMGYGEVYQAVGWVHDASEDSKITANEMLALGLPSNVVYAAELLRKKGDPHQKYLSEISKDVLAVVGKFADSSVNLATTVLRSQEIDDYRFDRWINTYVGNLSFLMPFLPPKEF